MNNIRFIIANKATNQSITLNAEQVFVYSLDTLVSDIFIDQQKRLQTKLRKEGGYRNEQTCKKNEQA
jgi:hypothetical protein